MTLRNGHIAITGWSAHNSHFERLCGFKFFTVGNHSQHFPAVPVPSVAVVEVVVDGHLIHIRCRHLTAIGVDAAHSGLRAISSHNRATEEEWICIQTAIGGYYKVFIFFGIVARTVNHTVNDSGTIRGAHSRNTTAGGASGVEEVAIHAHHVARAWFRLAFSHA